MQDKWILRDPRQGFDWCVISKEQRILASEQGWLVVEKSGARGKCISVSGADIQRLLLMIAAVHGAEWAILQLGPCPGIAAYLPPLPASWQVAWEANNAVMFVFRREGLEALGAFYDVFPLQGVRWVVILSKSAGSFSFLSDEELFPFLVRDKTLWLGAMLHDSETGMTACILNQGEPADMLAKQLLEKGVAKYPEHGR